MFKKFLQVLKQRNLMMQALDLTEEALDKSEKITRASLGALLNSAEPGFDVYATDREINEAEVEVRRLVFQHLAINPSKDLAPALIVTSVIIDIERIGDYAKNLFEVAERQTDGFPAGPISDEIRRVAEDILAQFGRAKTALTEGEEGLARQVMDQHQGLNQRCETAIEHIAQGGYLSAREAVNLVMTARFLKRISAHLSNLASSVVNPFDRIGFAPDSDTPVDAD